MKPWHLIIIEVLQVPLVIFVFKFAPNPQIGGIVAGSIFLLVGIFLANEFYKLLGRASWAFYFLMTHIFLFSFPMLSKRSLNWETNFSEIEVWGMPGPQFHKVSEYFYMILVVVSVLDILRWKKRVSQK